MQSFCLPKDLDVILFPQATLKCRHKTGYPSVLGVEHNTMDNPHILHHCAFTLTMFMLLPQLRGDSTTPHTTLHIHKYHNNVFPSSPTDTASTPPDPQHPALSVALHPNIGNVVLPLLLPRRPSSTTTTRPRSHHHHYHLRAPILSTIHFHSTHL